MWANIGEQQFHLPTRAAQKICGYIGLVMPDLKALGERLAAVQESLKGTQFSWSAHEDHVAVTCPWGNRFRCHESDPAFADMAQGLAYVEFAVPEGTTAIGGFYQNVLVAPAEIQSDGASSVAHIKIGRHQSLRFRESKEPSLPTMAIISPSMSPTFQGPIIFSAAAT